MQPQHPIQGHETFPVWKAVQVDFSSSPDKTKKDAVVDTLYPSPCKLKFPSSTVGLLFSGVISRNHPRLKGVCFQSLFAVRALDFYSTLGFVNIFSLSCF